MDQSLQSGNFEYRQAALAALATISGSNQEAVKRVAAVLRSDKDGRVRRSAALALGQMHANQAMPDLRAALDDSPEVAFAAAKALTEMGDSSGRDTLIAMLIGERKDSPGIMTNAVRDAQHRLRHPEGLMLMGAESATGAIFPPAGMGLDAATQAAKSMSDKTAPGRSSAVAYIARDSEPYAVTLLDWALTDNSASVRFAAAQALGWRGNQESVPKLQFLLSDSNHAVREMSAAALIRISTGDQKAPDGWVSTGTADRNEH